MSDIEVNEDDEMVESDPEVEEEIGVHKKTGDTHKSKCFTVHVFYL